MTRDCESWQFEIWLTPDLAEESCWWSDSKRDAYDMIKDDLMQRSISAHLLAGLRAGGASIARDYGRARFSVQIDGCIVRLIISKFDYSDPDDPGPGGGVSSTPPEGLVLVVFGSARNYQTIVIHGSMGRPSIDDCADSAVQTDPNIGIGCKYRLLWDPSAKRVLLMSEKPVNAPFIAEISADTLGSDLASANLSARSSASLTQ